MLCLLIVTKLTRQIKFFQHLFKISHWWFAEIEMLDIDLGCGEGKLAKSAKFSGNGKSFKFPD